ncbi:MAG: helix-turn-helix domain-containing protein [Nitrososphaera sp.]|jgi:sugar-specific transcriptional regulator TrmB
MKSSAASNSAQYDAGDLSEKLVSELRNLDLSQTEAKILVSLLVSGQSIASDISRSTGIQRTEVYQTLYSLQSKGVVFSTFEKPQKYYALSISDVIDALIQIKQNALKELGRRKGYCGELFERMMSSRASPKNPDRENYQIITGMDAIAAKVTKMVADAKEEVLVLISEKKLGAFYYMEIIDRLQSLSGNIKLSLKVMGGKNCDYLRKDILGDRFMAIGEQAFTCDFVGGNPMPINLVVVDKSEVIIMPEDSTSEHKEYGFYTNTKPLASTFAMVHERLK